MFTQFIDLSLLAWLLIHSWLAGTLSLLIYLCLLSLNWIKSFPESNNTQPLQRPEEGCNNQGGLGKRHLPAFRDLLTHLGAHVETQRSGSRLVEQKLGLWSSGACHAPSSPKTPRKRIQCESEKTTNKKASNKKIQNNTFNSGRSVTNHNTNSLISKREDRYQLSAILQTVLSPSHGDKD